MQKFKVLNAQGVDVTDQQEWYVDSQGKLYYAENVCDLVHANPLGYKVAYESEPDVDPRTLSVKELWGNFDKTYFKFQSDLHAFWGAIDVGRSRSYFADLYTNMHRLRRDMVSMLPDEVRRVKPQSED